MADLDFKLDGIANGILVKQTDKKKADAEEVAVESSMKYEMLKGSDIMDGKVDI